MARHAFPWLVLTLALAAPAAQAQERLPEPELPDALRGFAGELAGTVERTWEVAFTLRVAEVGRVWRHSTAREPGVAVGRTLLVNLRWEEAEGGRWRVAPDQAEWLRRCVQVGQRLRVDVRNDEGQRLHVMELEEDQREALARAREGGPAPGPRERAEREARERAEQAAREAREARERAERAEREARAARERAERAEREARAQAERAEHEAREQAERAERAAREQAEREGREQPAGGLPDPGLPDGMRGFSGTLEGLVVRTAEDGFLLVVTAVVNTWPRNEARRPEACVWRAVLVRAGERAREAHARWIATLRPGDEVRVEVAGAERLSILELSREQRERAERGR